MCDIRDIILGTVSKDVFVSMGHINITILKHNYGIPVVFLFMPLSVHKVMPLFSVNCFRNLYSFLWLSQYPLVEVPHLFCHHDHTKEIRCLLNLVLVVLS